MTSRSSTVKLKPTVWDGVIAAAVIAIAVIVAVVFYGNKTYSGELRVVVSVGNRVVDTLPLSDEEATCVWSRATVPVRTACIPAP